MTLKRLFIISNLNKFLYNLFLITKSAKVYYLDTSVELEKLTDKKNFLRLNTDIHPEIFENSLIQSFEHLNSDKFKNSDDYQICYHLLKSMLGRQPENELEIALKRLFHRDMYNSLKKILLINHVLKTNNDSKISIIDFTEDNTFYAKLNSAYGRPLKYIESTFVFLRKLFLKTFSSAYFLKIIRPFKIRFKTESKKTTVLIATSCKQLLFSGIYQKLVEKSIPIDFFMMDDDVSDKYESDFSGGADYFQKTDMVCSLRLLYIILVSFFKFYIKALRLKNINVYKNIFVFMEKYFTHSCILQNIKPTKILTNEDYPEFNPRYFAAKNNCEIINILTSKIVPLFNPYLSFCLVDKEISFTFENLKVREKSGCQVLGFNQLNNFDGFCEFMQDDYNGDISQITELVSNPQVEASDPRIITYYSSGGEHNFAYIDMPVKTKLLVLEPLRKYLAANNDIILIVKPHPGETNKILFDKEYHDLFSLPNVIILDVTRNISAYTLLQHSDLNIAATSTMGIHSEYFGLNTIVADMLNIDILFEEAERENKHNYRYVTSEEELFSAIKELTTEEKHYYKKEDGGADIFISEICQLILDNRIENKKTENYEFVTARI